MIPYLEYYAQTNLWCVPRMDNPSILHMARLTHPISGAINQYRIGDTVVKMPTRKVKYHLFQVGQVLPELIGLGSKHKGKWVRLDAACEVLDLIADVYYQNGLQHPKYRTWYQYLNDKNIVVAVEQIKQLGLHIETEKPYLRLYSGAWFNITRRDIPDDMIRLKSGEIVKEVDRNDFFLWYDEYSKKNGHVFIWINGKYESKLLPSHMKIGDVVEMLYDSTVYKKVRMSLSQLNTFNSDVDKKRKYLLTYAEKDNHVVDYNDDIDVYITHGDNNFREGIYYHRNNVDAMRQLTHRDYSIVVPYVDGFRQAHTMFDNRELKDIFVELFIRKSGFQRKLPFVNNRIHELYKLPYKYKVPAMLGIRSNVPVFKAVELEKAAFTEVMSSIEKTRDVDTIEKAFGYNALSIVMGNTPVKKKDFLGEGKTKRIALRNHLQPISTHFEFDENGLLLGYYRERNSCNYAIRYPNTELVESLTGYGDAVISDYFNPNNGFEFKPEFDYRVYSCPKDFEHIGDLSKWQDITGKYYTVMDGRLQWVEDIRDTHTVFIRSNERFLLRTFGIAPTKGVITLPLMQSIDKDGRLNNMRMVVPMGSLDIFMNGHSLVEGIDYFMDFPNITIVNKKYIKHTSEMQQIVVVRFHGFCDSELKHTPVMETGYIYDGQLSNNKIFNIQDDKVLRIIAGGGTFHRDDVGLFERKDKNKHDALLDKEGYPYQVKDIIVAMRNITNKDTMVMRSESMVIDKQVSDYMSQFQIPPVLDRHPEIKDLYPLYSPILGRIIHDLHHKQYEFDFEKMTSRLSKEDVMEFLKPYLPLRKVDPVFNDTSIDYEYVIVHPHMHNYTIELKAYEYRLLERIVEILFEDKVKTRHHVCIDIPDELEN